GVKIAAPNLDGAISGMPIRSCSGDKEEIKKLIEEVKEEVGEVLSETNEDQGVMIKADTIGGLEALRNLLSEKEVPIASASLGNVTKKDLSRLESLKDKDEFTGVLLGFNINIPSDITEIIKLKGLKVITHPVIYKTIEDYEEYVENLKKTIQMKELSKVVRPCKFAVLKGYTFRQSNPAIVGVEIEIGKIKTGDGIMNLSGTRVGTVKSLKEGQENVSLAEQGKQLAMAMEGVTVGRQVDEGDFLYADIPEEDFVKLKEMKKHLSKMEIEVLKQIAEIKRRDNPVWGVG
ncbi:translation initiation factor IF-2, partial [Candidatus Woesearchaeota archaeon]|nr:translation initiation factor IF-2 [Candidatus Woesearchaeota archaeon]